MITSEIYESVNWDKVKGHEEALAIAKLIPKIAKIHTEEKQYYQDFGTECFIIADHIDFLLFETFKNYDRKER